MSATSEESPAPDSTTDPIEALTSLSSLSRRASERAEPRLAAVVSERPLPRMPRIDALRQVPTPADRLETAMSEFVHRQLRPEPVPEPVDLKRDSRRRLMAAAAFGITAAVAIASVAALVFVSLFPRDKDVIQSFVAALPAVTSQLHASNDVAANAPPPQSRTLLAENDRGESFTHEQSERLLQQFVQWRQQIALVDKP
jgi:hypothetical protein